MMHKIKINVPVCALIWSLGWVLFSLTEGTIISLTDLYLPISTFLVILFIYGFLGFIGGIPVGFVSSFLAGWIKDLKIIPFSLATFIGSLIFLWGFIPLNEEYLPHFFHPVSILANIIFLSLCLGIAGFIYLRSGKMGGKQLIIFSFSLTIALEFLIVWGEYTNRYILSFSLFEMRNLLLYTFIFAACFALYLLLYYLPQFISNKFMQNPYVCLKALLTISLVLIIGGFIGSYFQNGSGLTAEKNKDKPNIVWIVIDTARADHFSSYGYHLKTTPHIDKIAEEGVLFSNAISPSSWTKPAHFEMVTSRFVSGVKGKAERGVLKNKWTTIAEVLKSRGYETGCIMANIILAKGSGFEQGFNTYSHEAYKLFYLKIFDKFSIDDLVLRFPLFPIKNILYLCNNKYFSLYNNRADHINNHVFDWLEKKSTHPFFLFVNYIDPHEPYDPPEEFKKKFLWENSVSPVLGFMRYQRALSRILSKNEVVRDKVDQLRDEEWQTLLNLYDGEISFVDAHVGLLCSKLKELNIFDKTILIITSDHGELFGEHDLWGHQVSLSEEEIRVPLIIRYPKVFTGGERITEQVQTIDIMPTIFDLLDISPGLTMDGISLLELLTSKIDGKYVDRNAFSYLIRQPDPAFPHKASGSLVSLRTNHYKYIWSSTGMDQYYDLVLDSKERQNLWSSTPDHTFELAQRLDRWREEIGIDFYNIPETNKMEMERLKALGYIQ